MDKTPEKPTPRTSKARTDKSAEPKPSIVSTSLQQTPVAPKRKTLTKKTTLSEMSTPRVEALDSAVSEMNATDIATPSDVSHMIATAAYYLAEQRHFAPGYETQDWLTAEQMIRDSARK